MRWLVQRPIKQRFEHAVPRCESRCHGHLGTGREELWWVSSMPLRRALKIVEHGTAVEVEWAIALAKDPAQMWARVRESAGGESHP